MLFDTTGFRQAIWPSISPILEHIPDAGPSPGAQGTDTPHYRL